MQYHPILSLLISLASILIAIMSFKRTKTLQDYDYAPRLNVESEKVGFNSSGVPDDPAIRYSGNIENRGMKPVKITNIHIDFGDKDHKQKRSQQPVEGEIHLGSGQYYPEYTMVEHRTCKKHE